MERRQKIRLAQACRILAMEGHEDATLGHVSALDPQSGLILMKRAGIGLGEVTEEDILTLDRAGNVVEGMGAVHSEFPLHSAIYAHRSEVTAVVHTHPRYCIALSSVKEPLLPLCRQAVYFRKVARFNKTTRLVTSRELAEEVVQALGDAPALLLRNHGLVTVGIRLEEACLAAIFLEEAARIQFIARTLGTLSDTCSIEEEHLDKGRGIYTWAFNESVWNYYVRKLGEWSRKPMPEEWG